MASMRRILLSVLTSACGSLALGHDIITTKITWDREISRIVYARCASCHHPRGSAFSLMTYQEARPWAKAIQEEALERRMPPWGAVKGFAEYRNDQALTPEQLELIGAWVDGGAPEGDAKDLLQDSPAHPVPHKTPLKVSHAGAVVATEDFKLLKNVNLIGLLPQKAPDGASFQVTAELPDGSIQPLLWLLPFKPAYRHAFVLREKLILPRGTIIRGIPKRAEVLLLQ